jgi:hypothetical protein
VSTVEVAGTVGSSKSVGGLSQTGSGAGAGAPLVAGTVGSSKSVGGLSQTGSGAGAGAPLVAGTVGSSKSVGGLSQTGSGAGAGAPLGGMGSATKPEGGTGSSVRADAQQPPTAARALHDCSAHLRAPVAIRSAQADKLDPREQAKMETRLH